MERSGADFLNLIRRIADRDEAAFESLYDSMSSRVFGLLRKILPRASDAEDALQETFCQVWRDASRFDSSRGSVEVWIFLIARSRAVDVLRRRSIPLADEALADLAERDEPGAAMERRETQAKVNDALQRLPEDQRTSIALAFFGGLTHVEVAERLDIPIGTAKTRIRRGMRRLLELLGPEQEARSA